MSFLKTEKTRTLLFLLSMASFIPGQNSSWAAGDGSSLQQNYNDAADVQESASDSRMITGSVYSAASAVCLTACVPAFTAAMQGACTGSSIGAAGADAVQTQQVGGIIQSLMVTQLGSSSTGTGAASAGAQGANSGEQGANAGAQGGDAAKNSANADNTAACVAAGANALQSFSNFATSKNQKDAAQLNRKSAEEVANNDPNSAQFRPTAYKGSSAAADNQSGNKGGLGSSSNRSGKGANSACSQARNSGDFTAAVACAVATDPSISSIVSNPNFPSALQRATGMNPSDFIRKTMNEGPAKSLGDVASSTGHLSTEGSAKAHALFAALDRQFGEYGGYTGGGSGGGGRSGGDNSQLAQSLQAMLAQFAPKEGTEGNKQGLLQGDSAKTGRFPANVAENRRVSLFDRVTNRYRLVSSRLQF
jgi:hypothetical protein